MTEHDDEFELDAHALAMIATYRSEEQLPTPVRERVWERVDADVSAASPLAGTTPAVKWAVVLLAAAAAIATLVIGAQVLTPADATSPGEQAPYERAAGQPSAAVPRTAAVEPTAAPRPAAERTDAPTDLPASLEPHIAPMPEETPAVTERETDAAPDDPTRRRPRRKSRPAAEDPATPEPVETLAAETHLLHRASASLHAGAPNRALAILADHERRFPRGALATERAALRVIALCDAGRTAEGSRAADAFLRTHPKTALAQRVRNACNKK